MARGDPVLHSHVSDVLPDGHKYSHKAIGCARCEVPLHASNNECMVTWVETGKGAFCIKCFAALSDANSLDEEYGLEEGSTNFDPIKFDHGFLDPSCEHDWITTGQFNGHPIDRCWKCGNRRWVCSEAEATEGINAN